MLVASTSAEPTITEVTRRAIKESLILEGICWSGDLDEVEFLQRMFDLEKLPSNDGRFTTASGDIWQHRINNFDWDEFWVFTDSRFHLKDGPDELLLRFLAEMVHPAVRRNKDQNIAIVKMLNEHLAPDGWELAERTSISGRSVYAARRVLGGKLALKSVKAVAEVIDATYIHQQISRLEPAVENDPDLAIGTAKELVETVCKTILDERKVAYDGGVDFPKLVRAVLKELNLAPDGIDDKAKVNDAVRLVLNSLATITNGMAELRNRLGTGHGRRARTIGAKPRHARLALGAASTLAVFLYETHQERAV